MKTVALSTNIPAIPNILTLAAFFLCAFVSISCFAQQIGTRDVTENWRAPEDHLSPPPPDRCPEVKSTISGGAVAGAQNVPNHAAAGEALNLAISSLSPPELHPGEEFIATVQLKNVGSTNVLVPWQTDGEQVTRMSSDADGESSEEKYEVADVNFRVVAGKKGGLPIYLQSAGALFAHPDNRASYIEIPPQHWVTIRFKGAVTCGLPACSTEVKPDEHAIFTATWYQRILTHTIQSCNENHSSLVVRQLDSAPLPVAIRRADSSSANPSRNNAH